MRRRDFLGRVAVGAVSVVGLTAQGSQAPAPAGREGGANAPQGRGGGRGRGPAPVAPEKLARVSLMTLNFNAYLKNPNNQNPTPDQTLTPFDLPKMYVETYGVHNIEYQHETIVQSETDPAFIKELKAKLDENKMTMTLLVRQHAHQVESLLGHRPGGQVHRKPWLQRAVLDRGLETRSRAHRLQHDSGQPRVTDMTRPKNTSFRRSDKNKYCPSLIRGVLIRTWR